MSSEKPTDPLASSTGVPGRSGSEEASTIWRTEAHACRVRVHHRHSRSRLLRGCELHVGACHSCATSGGQPRSTTARHSRDAPFSWAAATAGNDLGNSTADHGRPYKAVIATSAPVVICRLASTGCARIPGANDERGSQELTATGLRPVGRARVTGRRVSDCRRGRRPPPHGGPSRLDTAGSPAQRRALCP